MDFLRLQNGLTLKLTDVHHCYMSPRWIGVNFQLYPTEGVIFHGGYDVFRVFHLQWDENGQAGDLAVINAYLGASTADMLNAIALQWVEYKAGRTYFKNLKEVFDYVNAVGISP